MEREPLLDLQNFLLTDRWIIRKNVITDFIIFFHTDIHYIYVKTGAVCVLKLRSIKSNWSDSLINWYKEANFSVADCVLTIRILMTLHIYEKSYGGIKFWKAGNWIISNPDIGEGIGPWNAGLIETDCAVIFLGWLNNIVLNLMFAWPCTIDINNIGNQLDPTITVY